MVLYKDLDEMNRGIRDKQQKKNKLWKQEFNEVDKKLMLEKDKNKKLTDF